MPMSFHFPCLDWGERLCVLLRDLIGRLLHGTAKTRLKLSWSRDQATYALSHLLRLVCRKPGTRFRLKGLNVLKRHCWSLIALRVGTNFLNELECRRSGVAFTPLIYLPAGAKALPDPHSARTHRTGRFFPWAHFHLLTRFPRETSCATTVLATV